MISEANQDRLAAEHGACIMYTHLACGFCDGTRLNTRFRERLLRLSRMNGWFVPVHVLLDYLRLAQPGERQLTSPEEAVGATLVSAQDQNTGYYVTAELVRRALH